MLQKQQEKLTEIFPKKKKDKQKMSNKKTKKIGSTVKTY